MEVGLFEFYVRGPPISLQAKSASRTRWKQKVKAAAVAKWPAGQLPYDQPLKVTLVYYYEGDALDVDNMAKLILDALNNVIYVDDAQVTDCITTKRNINGAFRVKGMSSVLAAGFVSGEEFLHIKIEDAPDYGDML